MNVIVTGSSGWVGSAVVNSLQALGCRVEGLSRSRDSHKNFDLLDPQWKCKWPPLFAGADVIVHAAAHVHRPNETSAEQAQFHAINTVGVERLLDICTEIGVSRFLLVSTIAVYDWGLEGGVYNEDGPINPKTGYATSKASAELAVLRWSGDGRIGRLGTVFGSGDRANFALLARVLKQRRFFVPGAGSARKSVIHIRRAGEVLAQFAIRNDLSNRLLNLAAPHSPTLREICDGFASVCGFKHAPGLPLWSLQLAAKTGDLLAALNCRAPITSSILYKLTQHSMVDVTEMQKAFQDLRWCDFSEDLKHDAVYYLNV